MISDTAYKNAALLIGVENDIAVVHAVASVESSGRGLLANGKPKILFEPHVFWKRLRVHGLRPEDYVKGNEDILYPTWGERPYGPGGDNQYKRMNRAKAIHEVAALESASWGTFQCMGYNYSLCGQADIFSFVEAMNSEEKHIEMFAAYICNTHLDDELRAHDWKGFARGYNGPLYYRWAYDKKLEKEYLALS